jgi:hypothetical protein
MLTSVESHAAVALTYFEIAKRVDAMPSSDPYSQMVLFHAQTNQIDASLEKIRRMLEGRPPKVTDPATRQIMANELADIADGIRELVKRIAPER